MKYLAINLLHNTLQLFLHKWTAKPFTSKNTVRRSLTTIESEEVKTSLFTFETVYRRIDFYKTGAMD